MIDYLQYGGPMIWVLLAASILFLGAFLERWFAYHRAKVDVQEFLTGLTVTIRKGSIDEALFECSSKPVPVARVIYAILVRYQAPREELRQIAQEAGQLEVPDLERRLGIIAAVAYLSPLIGLMGTVLGMLQVFEKLSAQSGLMTSAEMASGVYESLLTSAAGLAIAVVAYLGYAYLSAWLSTLMHDMERGGIEVIHMLYDNKPCRTDS